MLTRHERLIYRYAKLIGLDEVITTRKLLDAGIPLSVNEIALCTVYMNEQGRFDAYTQNIVKEVTFHFSYSGQHPYELSWNELKRVLFRSVFLPCVVSFITSIITLWLRGIL